LRKITEAEYLEIEGQATYKSEFYDGLMCPVQPPPGVLGMAGATIDHNQIKDNVARALANALDGGRCRVMSSDMRVRSPVTGHQSYPDVVVFCGPPVFPLKNRRDVIANPTRIVEVLSDSTEEYDRGAEV
jgi:Uma2 family endonuclease